MHLHDKNCILDTILPFKIACFILIALSLKMSLKMWAMPISKTACVLLKISARVQQIVQLSYKSEFGHSKYCQCKDIMFFCK